MNFEYKEFGGYLTFWQLKVNLAAPNFLQTSHR